MTTTKIRAYYDVTKAQPQRFYFELIDTAGKKLLRSHRYIARSSVLHGVSVCKKTLARKRGLEIVDTVWGKFKVVLKSSNGFEMAESPEYMSREEATNILKKIYALGVEAPTRDYHA